MRQIAAAMALTAALSTGVLAAPMANATPWAEGVFRPYSGSTGLAQEMRSLADQYPTLAKLESIGKSVQGKDILVVKVTKNARTVPMAPGLALCTLARNTPGSGSPRR
ncbi:hypothetical protein LWC34_15050 [Kibdelosporangium philippinense]|uniref:Peptidase M14 domain-containing protein n=1 Tax=Kibdelosporangium philippinense TaxID=211113 RepID=A0ABS8Z8D5_9PSEU|nr:M14 family zinc carboxypeptidase [Kibdelosporangium philippinense]MCE7004141.1 hypothetical protein [Kibdelosporangium philippinense]